MKPSTHEICAQALFVHQARLNWRAAKLARAHARALQVCEMTCTEMVNGHAVPVPCWASSAPIEAWCGNCRAVAPYHQEYRMAALEYQCAQSHLTRLCAKMLAVPRGEA